TATADKGTIPAGVEVTVEHVGGEPEALGLGDVEGDAAEDEAPLSDEDWLATLPARSHLSDSCRSRFDLDALAFRAVTPHRLKFAAACRPITNKAKKDGRGHIGPWMSRHLHYIGRRDPSRWIVCGDCKGA
ncbi:hypothetical protein ACYOEI_01560, partial [Singulisphaera rosea]